MFSHMFSGFLNFVLDCIHYLWVVLVHCGYRAQLVFYFLRNSSVAGLGEMVSREYEINFPSCLIFSKN